MSSPNNKRSPQTSSASEGTPVDEKKRRRMESNRESARRSRLRKQQHLENLIKEAAKLQRENEEFIVRISEFEKRYADVEAQNDVLGMEKQRMGARLEALESVIEFAKGEGYFGEVESDTVMMTRMMKQPWQPSCVSMPAIASSGLSYFNFRA